MSEEQNQLTLRPAAKRRARRLPPAAEAPAAEPPPTEEQILEQLGHGAAYCHQVEQQLADFVTPELETIMKLHRMIILKLSTRAETRPELWDVLKDLMKPVMDWARLQEQSKEREFAEQKYRDQAEKDGAGNPAANENRKALLPETLERIEFELKLL
jgi:hypothetical protein